MYQICKILSIMKIKFNIFSVCRNENIFIQNGSSRVYGTCVQINNVGINDIKHRFHGQLLTQIVK